MSLDIRIVRHLLNDPDYDSDDRERLLRRAMTQTLVSARYRGQWDGSPEQATHVLHRAGFLAREILDLADYVIPAAERILRRRRWADGALAAAIFLLLAAVGEAHASCTTHYAAATFGGALLGGALVALLIAALRLVSRPRFVLDEEEFTRRLR